MQNTSSESFVHTQSAARSASQTSSGYNPTEEQLLLAMLDDEPKAWRTFNQRYSRLMYKCITRITSRFMGHVLCADDVSEIYASLCLQLIQNNKKKLRSFQPSRQNKLSTWIGLLATRATYDYLRTLRREPNKCELSEAAALPDAAPDVCDTIALYEQAHRMNVMLDTLSARDRQFMELYFGEGLGADRIAQTLGISVKTVYTKKHKILTKLQSLAQHQKLAA